MAIEQDLDNTGAMFVDKPSRSYLALICTVASLGGLLFGFDTAVIAGTVEKVKAQYDLSELWEGLFASSALIGCIVGAASAGTLGDRFGRKPILIFAALFFFVSALFSAIPPTFPVLIVARVIGGFGVGMASVMAPMYISEFSPPRWRGRLVALYQLSIVIGILAAFGSNLMLFRFSENNPDAFGGQGVFYWTMVQEVWRGMFGAEMIPAGLFFLLLFLVPESPRFLIETGKPTHGFRILEKISGTLTAKRELAEITEAVTREEGSLGELFKPGLRMALIVGIGLSVFGQLSGVNIVVVYGPKILMAAGFEEFGAFLGQVGFGMINLVFTIIAILVVDSLGRRPLLISGMAVVTVTMGIIGVLFVLGRTETTAPETGEIVYSMSRTYGLLIGIMICVYMSCIALSICAVIWILTPEIFPNRIRGRAVSIAVFSNWGTYWVAVSIFPWFVRHFGMHASFFTSAVICLIGTLFFLRFVPETKGKSLEEIEGLWLRTPKT